MLALAVPGAVMAQPVPIVNAGFESNAIADGAFFALLPTGWQVYDPSGIVNQGDNAVGVIRPTLPQTFFPGGAPQGEQAAIVYLAGPVSAPAGLMQTLTATLQPNTTYTLSVDVGNIGSGTSLAGSSGGGGVVYALDGFPGYRIELRAGGTLLASDSSSAGPIPEGQWRGASLSFDSSSTPALVGQAL
ncbi:MAG: hypothetical protein JNM26_17470, partial [Ideonella sp.]|nr:hypothetical protein [Ideonella sp.]